MKNGQKKAKVKVMGAQSETVRLSDFRLNPQNPSVATREELDRLVGKIKRNPEGLRAMRVAYITDDPEGGRMVISGNKRLTVLKEIYGEDGSVPAEWFVDVTAMDSSQRHEFIVNANMSDGKWDYDLLLQQYSRDELLTAGFASDLLDSLDGSMIDCLVEMGDELGDREKKQNENGTIVIHIPGELMSAWRSYNRKHGTDEIVEFVKGKLEEERKAVKNERDA